MFAHSQALFGFGGRSETSISEFVPANSIDNTSVLLAQSAISLLWGSPSIHNGTSVPLDGRGSGWGVDSKALLSYDIISAVQSSSDKSQTITQHISALNQSAASLIQVSQSYQSRITQSQGRLNDCSLSKKTADAAVIEAINNNQLTNLDTLLQASVTAGQCETQQKITINAFTLVVNKTNSSIALLNNKSSLIEQHRSVIMQYPEIISDPAIIAELSQASLQF